MCTCAACTIYECVVPNTLYFLAFCVVARVVRVAVLFVDPTLTLDTHVAE